MRDYMLMLMIGALLIGCQSAPRAPRVGPPPPAAEGATPAEPGPTPVPATNAYERVQDLLESGKVAAARELAEGYFENPQTRDRAGVYSLILVARHYWHQGEYKQVVELLAPIPHYAPQHAEAPWALLTIAQAYLKAAREGSDPEEQFADLKQAAGYLDRYVDDYPQARDMAQVLFWSGVAEQQMGNLEKADERYRRLRQEYPRSPWNTRLGPTPE